MNWLNDFTQWFDAMDNNLKLVWDKSTEISSSLTALNHEIQSLTQFVQNLQSYMTIILIAMAIQFVIIIWMWSGQAAMKKKLENIEAFILEPKEVKKHG